MSDRLQPALQIEQHDGVLVITTTAAPRIDDPDEQPASTVVATMATNDKHALALAKLFAYGPQSIQVMRAAEEYIKVLEQAHRICKIASNISNFLASTSEKDIVNYKRAYEASKISS